MVEKIISFSVKVDAMILETVTVVAPIVLPFNVEYVVGRPQTAPLIPLLITIWPVDPLAFVKSVKVLNPMVDVIIVLPDKVDTVTVETIIVLPNRLEKRVLLAFNVDTLTVDTST